MFAPLLITDVASVTKPELHHGQMFLVCQVSVIKHILLSQARITVTRVVTDSTPGRLTLVLQGTRTFTRARGGAAPVAHDQVSAANPPAPAGDVDGVWTTCQQHQGGAGIWNALVLI